MDVETPPASGDPETDSLVELRWITAGAPLSFGFPTAAGQFTGYANGEPFDNFEPLNALQQAAARAAFASISSFTNLVFTELAGADAADAMLRFGMTDDSPTAHAYLPASGERAGDSWYRNADGNYDEPRLGNYAWLTFEHEIGHALGLIHPHESAPPMDVHRDWMPFTVMSYRSSQRGEIFTGYSNDEWGFAQTYMMEDIAALQFLYGANFTYNNSDTVYQWNPATGEMSVNGVGQGQPGGNRIFMTVWDGGGTDTYDFSNYSGVPGDLRIDLGPGQWTELGSGQSPIVPASTYSGNIANALLYGNDNRSLIENVIGSPGSDTIGGNFGANYLRGGAGLDIIYGGGGDDILDGGDHSDQLYGGEGNDTLYSGEGSGPSSTPDTLFGEAGDDLLHAGMDGADLRGGDGNDRLEGGGDRDFLTGEAGSDTLFGYAGKDNLEGEDGNDSLDGGAGDDELVGGAGNDALTGGDGGDWLDGGADADLLTGGLGDDIYILRPDDQLIEMPGQGLDWVLVRFSYAAPDGIENIVLTETPGGATLTGNGANNSIVGNTGNDLMIGGGGIDLMFGWTGDDTYYVDDPNDVVGEPNWPADFVLSGGFDTIYSSVSYALLDEAIFPIRETRMVSSVPSLTFGANQVELLVLTGTADLSGTGNLLANRIEGNSGANVITGLGGADELVGGSGADVFVYASASDSVVGQEDWLSDFEHGTDRIDLSALAFASLAFETFESNSPGAWTRVSIGLQSGGQMSLRVAGMATAADFASYQPVVPGQTLIGTDGDDALVGGTGNDTLDGRNGADTMTGLGGDDWYSVDDAGDTVIEGAAEGSFDRIFASVNYRQGAGVHVEALTTADAAGTAAIALTGNGLANFIGGNAGANVIDGRGGADTMVGLGGDDWYTVDNVNDVVVEGAADGAFDRIFASASYAQGAGVHVEALTIADAASTTAINLTGNEFANFIGGNAGANVLDGGGGADTLVGLGGDDWYYVDHAGDVVVEGVANGAFDRIFARASYTQGTGVFVEALTIADAAGTAAIDLGGNELANFIGGNAGANTLSGGAGDDTLIGLGGGDRLVGGIGADTMIGGTGDDWYYVDHAGDAVTEGAAEGSFDRIFASASFALGAGVHIEALTIADAAGTTAINLGGNELANFIGGNAGSNAIDGGANADTMIGLGGDDWYYVDNAGDVVIEGAANGAFDRIFARASYTQGAGVHVEALTIADAEGTAAIDLTGNELDNFIGGNAGANVLDGRGGADTMVGLGGQDTFAFTTTLGGGNIDAVIGFVAADDTIQLDDAVFTGLATGALAAGAFVTGSAAADADDRIVYDSATGALWFDADGNGAGAAMQFATLGTGLALTSADFLVA